jgi:hypothetical protein
MAYAVTRRMDGKKYLTDVEGIGPRTESRWSSDVRSAYRYPTKPAAEHALRRALPEQLRSSAQVESASSASLASRERAHENQRSKS